MMLFLSVQRLRNLLFSKKWLKKYNLKIVQPITEMTKISNWLHSFQ